MVEHGGLHILASNFTEVTYGNALSGNTAHLNSISESEVMIDSCFLMIPNVIVNDTEIDVSQEFTCNISDLLMLVVELNSLLVEIGLIGLSKFHIINTNTVV